MKHQTQPTANSCMATCVAMILDKPVSEVIEQYHDGLVNQDLPIAYILDQYNVTYSLKYSIDVTMNPGFVYILCVPSNYI